jgi:hypothetical protein|eukprot:SAG25_NODE_659_length_6098_cov_41.853476_2_plen_172_part_00
MQMQRVRFAGTVDIVSRHHQELNTWQCITVNVALVCRSGCILTFMSFAQSRLGLYMVWIQLYHLQRQAAVINSRLTRQTYTPCADRWQCHLGKHHCGLLVLSIQQLFGSLFHFQLHHIIWLRKQLSGQLCPRQTPTTLMASDRAENFGTVNSAHSNPALVETHTQNAVVAQ